VALSPDGRRAVTVGQDGQLHLWELDSPRVEAAASEVTALIELRAGDQTNARVAIGNARGEFRIAGDELDLTSSPICFHAHVGRVWDVAASRCGRWLISAGDDGTIVVLDTQSGRPVARSQAASAREICKALAVSLDGKTLLAAAGAGLQAWDLEAIVAESSFGSPCWERAPGCTFHKSPIRALCPLPGGLIASAGEDAKVLLLDRSRENCITSLDHGGASARSAGPAPGARGVYTLTSSRCGRYLACSGRGQDRAITIWDLADPASPKLVNVLHGHLRGTSFLAFDEDGERLWSGSWDQTVALWNWHRHADQRLLVRPVAGLSAAWRLAGTRGLMVGTALGDVFRLELQGD
jgi:WD40 repeat protein